MYDGIQAYGGVKVSIYNMMYKKRDNLRIYYSNFFGKKNMYSTCQSIASLSRIGSLTLDCVLFLVK